MIKMADTFTNDNKCCGQILYALYSFILYQGSVDHYNVSLIHNRMQVMESFLNTILIWEMYVLYIL